MREGSGRFVRRRRSTETLAFVVRRLRMLPLLAPVLLQHLEPLAFVVRRLRMLRLWLGRWACLRLRLVVGRQRGPVVAKSGSVAVAVAVAVPVGERLRRRDGWEAVDVAAVGGAAQVAAAHRTAR